MTRVVIDLVSNDEKAVLSALKFLLKRLLRDRGLRCKAITISADA